MSTPLKNGFLLKATGTCWAFGSGALLTYEIVSQSQSEFWLGWPYYILVWGLYLFCFVSGILLVLSWNKSRFLLASAATLVILYALIVLGMYGAETKTIFIVELLLLVAFAVGTLFVVQRAKPG